MSCSATTPSIVRPGFLRRLALGLVLLVVALAPALDLGTDRITLVPAEAATAATHGPGGPADLLDVSAHDHRCATISVCTLAALLPIAAQWQPPLSRDPHAPVQAASGDLWRRDPQAPIPIFRS